MMDFLDDDIHWGIATSKSLYWGMTLLLVVDFRDGNSYKGMTISFPLMKHGILGVITITFRHIHFWDMGVEVDLDLMMHTRA